MLLNQPISPTPFKKWLWQDPENKRLMQLSVSAIILSFILLKILYPYPNFMPPDSNSYLEAAYKNSFINIWPIGYSKFLRLFSSFTSSDVALVCFQYLLFQASLLYFLFTFRYLLAPGKWLFRIILMGSVLNPLIPQISNFISSDALFTALSLTWFTQLFWILYKPNLRLLVAHAIVLLLAFMVRYNALYYPIISIIIIAVAPLRIGFKITGVGTIVLLLSALTARTEYSYYKDTKTIQFSAFGGWQIAANALYGYAHSTPDSPATVPARFRKLHTLVNRHMDSLSHMSFVLRPDYDVSIYYLWDFKSPLKLYLSQQHQRDSSISYFHQWASVAPLYADYGQYLIKKHPVPFVRYYLWPNLIKYYAPPLGFMGSYNIGRDTINAIAARWFAWKNNKVHSYFKDKEIKITAPFPTLFAIFNLIYIIGFLFLLNLGGLNRYSSYNRYILWLTLVVWLSNMVFSVFSAPIELRYQIFPFLFTFSFDLFLLAFIIEQSKVRQPGPAKYQQVSSTLSQWSIPHK